MQYGDLSNLLAPAIVVNADLLGEIKRSKILRRKSFQLFRHTRDLMTGWFYGGLSLYVVCIGDYAKLVDDIAALLDKYFVPYTTIEAVEDVRDLDFIVSAKHVMGYYYNANTVVDERMSLAKHHKVMNIAEINYLINGGEYR